MVGFPALSLPQAPAGLLLHTTGVGLFKTEKALRGHMVVVAIGDQNGKSADVGGTRRDTDFPVPRAATLALL